MLFLHVENRTVSRDKEKKMKSDSLTISQAVQTTMAEVVQWSHELARLYARIAPHFARPEPRRRVLAYLQGLLSETPRKNGWQLAEQAGERTPYGMQRLLSSAVWKVDRVRDEVRAYVLEQLGTQQAIVAIDETSFPKAGRKSAGVGIQYCGTTGHVQNCQVGVFLSYITARGHSLIDRELYLPSEWTQDPERRQEAGIPQTARFQTKPELARAMLQRLYDAQVPIDWVVGDSVYGENLDLRTWLTAHGYAFVLEVHCDEEVGIVSPDGRRRLVRVCDVPALLLSEPSWQRLSMSEGTKGPRLFDWACVPILHRWQQDGRHWLLLRRSVTDAQDLRYYLVFAPASTTREQMVQASGGRWRIEEDFENGKDLGLDHYEVRSWSGWYRHITLVILALAFLTGICASLQAPPLADAAEASPPSEEREPAAVEPSLLGLTVPEVRHLLAHLIWPALTTVSLVLAWSNWRRCHRSWASYYHRQRRQRRQSQARSP
jgi:SRSO17 transposase